MFKRKQRNSVNQRKLVQKAKRILARHWIATAKLNFNVGRTGLVLTGVLKRLPAKEASLGPLKERDLQRIHGELHLEVGRSIHYKLQNWRQDNSGWTAT